MPWLAKKTSPLTEEFWETSSVVRLSRVGDWATFVGHVDQLLRDPGERALDPETLPGRVERPADDVVPDARQIADTATAHEHESISLIDRKKPRKKAEDGEPKDGRSEERR